MTQSCVLRIKKMKQYKLKTGKKYIPFFLEDFDIYKITCGQSLLQNSSKNLLYILTVKIIFQYFLSLANGNLHALCNLQEVASRTESDFSLRLVYVLVFCSNGTNSRVVRNRSVWINGWVDTSLNTFVCVQISLIRYATLVCCKTI